MADYNRFPRVWWPVFAVGLVCLGTLYWSARFAIPVIRGGVSDEKVLTRLLSALILALAGPYLLWTQLRDVFTEFNEGGLRPTVFGRRRFLWRDLTRIDSRGTYGVLVFRDGRVGINLMLFRHPQSVVIYVREKMPATAAFVHTQLRNEQ